MSEKVRNYDPSQVNGAFAGIPLTGIADGTFIKAARAEKTFSTQVGAGGEVARTRNRNRTGTVEFTAMQTSPVNDLLSAQFELDELTGQGTGELLIKDNFGTTLIQSTDAWIEGVAEVEFGKEAGSRVWTIACADLKMHAGGSTTTANPA